MIYYHFAPDKSLNGYLLIYKPSLIAYKMLLKNRISEETQAFLNHHYYSLPFRRALITLESHLSFFQLDLAYPLNQEGFDFKIVWSDYPFLEDYPLCVYIDNLRKDSYQTI